MEERNLGTTHVDMHNKTRKIAFTLAEVLITLGIIGVVAALILPRFMHDMSERINTHRQANIAQKITKSVELMITNGDYGNIYSTEDFANRLTKYLKVVKKCNYQNIADCWPTDTIKTSGNKVYDVSKAKTGKDLHIDSDTNNVGLILADGAAIILNFNPAAQGISTESNFKATKKDLPVGKGKTVNLAYTSSATDAIDFVMDVNGKDGPNQEPDFNGNYYDIRSFKNANFTFHECLGEYGSAGCVLLLPSNPPLYCAEDNGTEDIKFCGNNPHKYPTDYWAGAGKACDLKGMRLPSVGELQAIYGKLNEYPSLQNQTTQRFWSSSESQNDTRCSNAVYFGHGGVIGSFRYQSYGVICVDR